MSRSPPSELGSWELNPLTSCEAGGKTLSSPKICFLPCEEESWDLGKVRSQQMVVR